MQRTATHRQYFYWCQVVQSIITEGYVRDERLQWGATIGGALFHRSITTFTVRFLMQQLIDCWMPNITCPLVQAWVRQRHRAGLRGEQLVAGFVMAFLDDFFPFLCGNQADITLGHQVIMSSLEKLGFKLSAAKLLSEGTPAATGVILGHGFDLDKGVRFITPHKKMKIAKLFSDFADSHAWTRKILERGLGLLQSVRRDVSTRWHLQELYRILHTPGFGAFEPGDLLPRRRMFVTPTALGLRNLSAVLSSLSGARPLHWIPTRWPVPSHHLMEGCPMVDAATSRGYGGVLLYNGHLTYSVECGPKT